MIGILKQSSKGWFVWYTVMKEDKVTSGYDSISLHQEYFDTNQKQPIIALETNKEVEFEIVRYCPYHKCAPSEPKGCTIDCAYTEVKYARIINTASLDYNGEETQGTTTSTNGNKLYTQEQLKQAFEMEKDQIIDAATWGGGCETGEQYYKEKYTKNKL